MLSASRSPPAPDVDMEPAEKGDDYLTRLAAYIRLNERALAEAGAPRRKQQRQAPDALSYINPLSWLGTGDVKPAMLSTDTQHLFYVLMRLEALDYPVGTLDVQIDNPSRPMTYVNLFVQPDKSDTLSLASFRSSFSAVSRLSLGGGWWSRADLPSVDSDLRYIYSSFTKLPALVIHAPTKSTVEELVKDPPGQNALPLDSFKNLQILQCIDIDPRTLLGWDKLAESLRSLTIKKSALEDISDVFIGAVVDDAARREGSASRKRKRRIPNRSGYSTPLPDIVVEEEPSEGTVPLPQTSPPPPQLSSMKWAFLKHLSLADNALTFIAAETLSHLTSLSHLDLSSNLLVSIPPALSHLYNLVSLNLSDNMIDSVLGIYLNLGQILYLNLSHNRLESLCGLERLHALERVDLRSNLIDESSEVGRLATLPNITELWIEGNPFVECEEQYRVACFNYFWSEGKSIALDGAPPGFYEKRSLSAPPLEVQSQHIAHSPPAVAIGSPHQHRMPPSAAIEGLPIELSPNSSPNLHPHRGAGEKKRRKQQRRIVEFGGSDSKPHPEDAKTDNSSHKKTTAAPKYEDNSITPTPSTSTVAPPSLPTAIPGHRSRHGYQSSSEAAFSPPRTNSLTSQSAIRSGSMWDPGREETAPCGKDGAEEYRRRIEALKQDMGDGWLKIFSQSEIKSSS